jgi:hypothetical protein
VSKEIVAALIGAAGAIAAALIAWFASVKAKQSASVQYSRAHTLVNPQGRWKCDWFNEDGSLYVTDLIEIESWVRPGAFKGRGVQPDLSYTVHGEIDSTRAMALTYRTEDFPKKAFVGVAFLLFDTHGERLTGRWYGRGRDGQLAGGTTEWSRSS